MNPWMQVTGWTLIHFIWQGGLIALATAAGLRLCRHRSSDVRYAIACVGLASMLASPIVTAAFFRAPASGLVTGGDVLPALPRSEGALPLPRLSTDESSVSNGAAAVARIRLDAWLPFVVWGWLAGVTFLLARFAGGCWRVHRLRVTSLAEAVSRWQSASERLAARLRLDIAFRVVESRFVDAPGVIGWMRPLILLPAAVLTNLTPVQIEAILAHELAHIRRRDYAVNLLQTVVETLLFYHPGVWWVSARVREEREHCCDDVAVEMCGEPTAYVAALAELASWRTGQTALAVAATDGSLLARVRRLLRAPEDEEPRSISGLVILALSMLLGAGVAVQSSLALASAQSPVASQPQTGGWSVHTTDHFEIHYQPALDLHAERVGLEAERAYDRVSSDLKHNLAFKVPIILFPTTKQYEESVQSSRLGQPHPASFADPSRDRILLAMDQPADRWHGLITHEVTHVFGFDIVPGTATPRWITEGLAEYERGAWDPSDLVALREVVRANAIPKMSGLSGDDGNREVRVVYALGHAAFDFIESRWGKPGVRQFIFWLRQTALNGGDPYEGALQVKRDEFDQAFERYLRARFAASAVQSPAERFDDRATLRIEGEITGIKSSVLAGLACIELVVTDGEISRRWAVECGDGMKQDDMRGLRPGDRVIVTGSPARNPASPRLLMQGLVRPSDGFTWRARVG
jgi:beta-lactamase regulating signal transducer with metallopeptidase domain